MSRRRMLLILVFVLLTAAGLGVYTRYFAGPAVEHVAPPTFNDNAAVQLPPTATFDDLAAKDPVRMLEACLSRYTREVGGFRAVLEKEETLSGESYPREVIRLAVTGENGPEPKLHVRMVWEQGARIIPKRIGAQVKAALYVAGRHNDEVMTWRPAAWVEKESWRSPEGDFARSAARYCIKDTGLRTVMLRTFSLWQEKQKSGNLTAEYLGRRIVPEIDPTRECHVIRRVMATPEMDDFALGEKTLVKPAVVEKEGFTSVTIYVDADRWLQVGTELRRGDTVIGRYYYKAIELNPVFPPDTFTAAAAKAAAK